MALVSRTDDRSTTPRDEEEDDDARDQQPLGPELQQTDERDDDEPGKDLDEALPERVGREREAPEAREEGDVEREEHRQATDQCAAAGSRIETHPHATLMR